MKRSIPNFRAQALLALLCRHPLSRQRAQAILARHPQAAALVPQKDVNAPPLDEVLWREMESTETGAGSADTAHAHIGRAPWEYYQGTRRAARLRRWAHAAARLSEPWVGLMSQDAPGAVRKCAAVGIEMLAVCVAATGDTGAWLTKLGATLAIEVIRRAKTKQRPAISDQMIQRWQQAYADLARTRAGSDVVSKLGRKVLAEWFCRLSESNQQLAATTAASNLFEVLKKEPPFEPLIGDEWGAVESLVRFALAADDSARAEQPAAGKALGT